MSITKINLTMLLVTLGLSVIFSFIGEVIRIKVMRNIMAGKHSKGLVKSGHLMYSWVNSMTSITAFNIMMILPAYIVDLIIR